MCSEIENSRKEKVIVFEAEHCDGSVKPCETYSKRIARVKVTRLAQNKQSKTV